MIGTSRDAKWTSQWTCQASAHPMSARESRHSQKRENSRLQSQDRPFLNSNLRSSPSEIILFTAHWHNRRQRPSLKTVSWRLSDLTLSSSTRLCQAESTMLWNRSITRRTSTCKTWTRKWMSTFSWPKSTPAYRFQRMTHLLLEAIPSALDSQKMVNSR